MISLTTVRTASVGEERAHRVFEVAGGNFGGKLMVTRRTGRAVRETLEGALEALPKGGILYVDTRGVELMDYSFADEALGILASRSASGEYEDRHLVLVEEDRDLLENVEASLRQRSLAMIRVDRSGLSPASSARCRTTWSRPCRRSTTRALSPTPRSPPGSVSTIPLATTGRLGLPNSA
jgi:hypothetical protein